MARIKIEDLPRDMEINDAEMKKLFAGTSYTWRTSWFGKVDWKTPTARILGPSAIYQEPLGPITTV